MTKDEWYAQLFERLGNSKFRSSFHLKQKKEQESTNARWHEFLNRSVAKVNDG
jgi:hypothetical protein